MIELVNKRMLIILGVVLWVHLWPGVHLGAARLAWFYHRLLWLLGWVYWLFRLRYDHDWWRRRCGRLNDWRGLYGNRIDRNNLPVSHIRHIKLKDSRLWLLIDNDSCPWCRCLR